MDSNSVLYFFFVSAPVSVIVNVCVCVVLLLIFFLLSVPVIFILRIISLSSHFYHTSLFADIKNEMF